MNKKALNYVRGGKDNWQIAAAMKQAHQEGLSNGSWIHLRAVTKQIFRQEEVLLLAAAYALGLINMPIRVSFSGELLENGIDLVLTKGQISRKLQFKLRGRQDKRSSKNVDLVVYIDENCTVTKFLASLQLDKFLTNWPERAMKISTDKLYKIEYALNHLDNRR